MRREAVRKILKIGCSHGVAVRLVDRRSQFSMVLDQVADQAAQLRKPLRCREEHPLLGVEVERDLLLKEVDNLPSPAGNLLRRGPRRAFYPYAEGECMLVLVRKRDEGRVAKHAIILPALRKRALRMTMIVWPGARHLSGSTQFTVNR